jgi:hypothetical protein
MLRDISDEWSELDDRIVVAGTMELTYDERDYAQSRIGNYSGRRAS